MPRWWGYPVCNLHGRLAASYGGVAVLAVIVSSVAISGTLWNTLLDRIALDLVGEANVLADHVSIPLAQGDTAAVSAYIRRMDDLTTAHILVADRTGTVLVVTDPVPRVPQEEQRHLAEALAGRTVLRAQGPVGTGQALARVVVPVRTPAGEVVGAVRESYNWEDLRDLLWDVNVTAALGALAAAILAGAVGLICAASIARPIQRVARGALALSQGRSVAPLPKPRGSTDELHDLVHAFNGLASQLATHEQARREFASDVSHELHALASAMQTAAAALERSPAEPGSAPSRRLVAGLVGHTRRLNRLASDLLELARWDGGHLDLEREDLDVTDLVQGVLDEWAAEVERRGMTLQVHLANGPLPVHGDPVRLAQALGNLLENALKYAGGGGSIRIDVRVDPQRRTYDVGVEDSGPGIPAEALPRVFERYYRVEGRAGGGPGGMGLGLAIARGIARAHEGDLFAESTPGGARFVLRLPAPPHAKLTAA